MGFFERLKYSLTKNAMPYQAKPGANSPHTDPVCGMKVDPQSPIKLDFQGSHYLFCSKMCLNRFQKNPSRYIHKAAA